KATCPACENQRKQRDQKKKTPIKPIKPIKRPNRKQVRTRQVKKPPVVKHTVKKKSDDDIEPDTKYVVGENIESLLTKRDKTLAKTLEHIDQKINNFYTRRSRTST